MLQTANAPNGNALFSAGMEALLWHTVNYADVAPQSIETLKTLYRRSNLFKTEIHDRKLTAAPVWLSKLPELADPWILTLQTDEDLVQLVLPYALISFVYRNADPDLSIETLSSTQRALILECVLSDVLDTIEGALACPVSIISAEEYFWQHNEPGPPPLALQIEVEGLAKTWGALKIGQTQTQRLAQALERLRTPARPAITVDLPVPLHLRWASVDLSLSQIMSLAPGDIILPDFYSVEPETVVAVIGDHLIARVKILPDGYELIDIPRPAKGSGLDWCLPHRPAYHGFTQDAALDDIPMRLFFELEHFDLPIAKLRELKPGSRLGSDSSRDAYFNLVVDDVRIGRGERTAIGGSAGVRLVKV